MTSKEMPLRFSRRLAGGALALALVAGSEVLPQGQSIRPAAAQPPGAAPPLPAGPAADLDLVFTGQVAGYVEPCG